MNSSGCWVWNSRRSCKHSCGCRVRSCARAGSWCTACCRGIRTSESFGGWCPCSIADGIDLEVGIRMSRSAAASVQFCGKSGETYKEYKRATISPDLGGDRRWYAVTQTTLQAYRPRELRLFKV